MQREFQDRVLSLHLGDITTHEVDAIVNAANAALAGGGGVDGAIHRAGGRSIIEETRRRYPDGCPTGSAVISEAGTLAARYVIHAVGPRYRNGEQGEAELLTSAYHRSLRLVTEHACRTVAFPAISAGVYGYPLAEAAQIAIGTVANYLQADATKHPTEVRFVLFSQSTYDVFAEALRTIAS